MRKSLTFPRKKSLIELMEGGGGVSFQTDTAVSLYSEDIINDGENSKLENNRRIGFQLTESQASSRKSSLANISEIPRDISRSFSVSSLVDLDEVDNRNFHAKTGRYTATKLGSR